MATAKNQRWRAGVGLALLLALLFSADRAPRLGVDALSAATRPGQAVVGSVVSDYQLIDQPRPRATLLDAEGVRSLVRWSDDLSYGLGNVAPRGHPPR